ncbi:MAG: conjugal transfer protein TraH [Gammaproteobacteria bacterium]
MKKSFQTLVASISLFCCGAANADWVNNWFDHSKIDGASSYKNQQRGFYSAGGFSGRFNTATDHLLTISKPKLSSGCGGIDGFMGGISFLDEDYIVQKFQSMMQVAPAMAFDMVLKTMCKECSETLTKLDAAATWLNSLQLNECAMSKRMVVTASKADPNIMGEVWNEITSGVSLKEATDRSWHEAQEKIRANDNKPTTDLKAQVAGCPLEVSEIFKTGSVIANATAKVGMSEYANIIRGYMGDVKIQAGKEDFIPTAIEITACPQNQKTSIEDMLYGHAYAKDVNGDCVKDTERGVMSIVREKLKSIAAHMKAGTKLDPEEEKFINATANVPVYSILRKAIIKDNVDLQIDLMTELVAINYTFYIFSDLYRNTEFMFNKVKAAMESGASAGDKPCDMRVYAQASQHFNSLYSKLKSNQRAVLTAYQQKLNSLAISMQYQHLNEQDDKQVNRNISVEFEKAS